MHGGNPYVDTPSEFAADPAYEHAGAAWRETTSVYGPDFTLLSELVALVSGSSSGRGRLDLQGPRGGGCPRVRGAGREARAGPRPRQPRSSAGTRSSPFTSRAAATTTRCWRRSCSARWRWRPRAAGPSPGRPGQARSCSSGSRSCSWCFARSRRAPPAGASTTAGSRSPALVLLGLATWRYGFDWVRAFGPLARNAEGQTSYALPAPGRAARRSLTELRSAWRRWRWPPVLLARAGGAPRPRTARALGVPPARDNALACTLVHDLGATPRGGGGRPASAS